MAKPGKCKATTKAGKPCKRPAVGRHKLCSVHKGKGSAAVSAGGRPKRKAVKVYAAAFRELGKPPEDPIELFLWCQRANAIALHLTMTGEGDDRMNAQIRTLTASVGKGLPVDKIVAAVVAKQTNPSRPRSAGFPEYDESKPTGSSDSGSVRG